MQVFRSCSEQLPFAPGYDFEAGVVVDRWIAFLRFYTQIVHTS